MKKIIALFTLAFFVFLVTGCSKDAGSMDPISANSGKHFANSAAANVDPAITISYSNSPWNTGVSGNVTVSLGSGQDLSGTTAKFQLYKGVNSVTGSPCCADDPNVSWVQVAQSQSGANSLVYNFTPQAAGNYGWKVHFVKGNSDYTNGFEIGTCLQVTDGGCGCPSGGA